VHIFLHLFNLKQGSKINKRVRSHYNKNPATVKNISLWKQGKLKETFRLKYSHMYWTVAFIPPLQKFLSKSWNVGIMSTPNHY